ncbi:MAG: TetR/AcrR family transcriptional regulator [Alphaproteobacteria bacterium]|nr:TetR/AcrR family transcriptional regulator [Alphaproteobacteria bacterium]
MPRRSDVRMTRAAGGRRDGAATKERIRASALALFVSDGLKETTTKAIAAASGISEGAIYRHYESKDALARDLYLLHYAQLAEGLRAATAGETAFAARWRAIVVLLCRLFDEQNHAFRYLLLGQHQHLDAVSKAVDSPVETLRGFVAEAVERAEIARRDPDLATAMALGLVITTATFVLYGQLEGPLSRWADEVAKAGLRVLEG